MAEKSATDISSIKPFTSGKDSTAKVRFHALGAGGEAVGRDTEGRTVFASLAAPDDEAAVEIVETQARFARGRIIQLLNASPHRVAPPCPYYQRETESAPQPECGGCQWQHIEYSMQLQAKRERVVQTLQRIGGVANANEIVESCIASPREFGYRNKADFVVNAQNDGWQIGFFAHNTHRVVDVAHCLIQNENNNALLSAVRAACDSGLASPFDAQSKRGVLKRVLARTSSSGETLLIVETTDETWSKSDDFARYIREYMPQCVGVLQRLNRHQTRLLSGRDWLEETVDGLRFRVTGDGFFQVNTSTTPLLLQTALRLANVQRDDRVLDLYCGVGLFALGAARLGGKVLGIEQSVQAIENARFNAQNNELQADFVAGDVAEVLRRRAREHSKRKVETERFDLVLLDPPRAGAVSCLEEIVRLEPRRIVYVSCDAATLARDIRALNSAGYVLAKAVPLDLFPQTAHVETVALLERS